MNEQKDDLLAAFENPDISTAQEVKEEVAPVEPAPVAPAPEVAPAQVEPAPEVAQPEPAPVAPAPEVAQAPVEEVKPAKKASKNKKEEEKDEVNLKKNVTFLIILCVIITAFIIFLPTIISLISGTSF